LKTHTEWGGIKWSSNINNSDKEVKNEKII